MGIEDVKKRQDSIASKVDDNSERLSAVEAYQKANHESFQKLENKIDKLILCFITASVGMIITLVISR